MRQVQMLRSIFRSGAVTQLSTHGSGLTQCLPQINDKTTPLNATHKSTIALRAIVLATLLEWTALANAQNLGTDATIDIQESRSSALAAPASLVPGGLEALPNVGPITPFGVNFKPAGPARDFALFLIAPIYFNDNPTHSQMNGRSGLEGDPELRLDWNHQFDWVRLSARLDSDMDRFNNNAATSGTDKFYARIGAALTDGKDDQAYIPQVTFGPTLTFDPTFSKRQQTANDLTIAVAKVFNFDANFKQAEPGKSTAKAAWSFGISVGFQRRFRDPDPSSYAVIVTPSVKHIISEDWLALLQVNITRRLYDSLQQFSRRDWLINPIATVAFKPPASWFGSTDQVDSSGQTPGQRRWAELGAPEIDFQLSFAQQDSNKRGATFHQLSVGPGLSAVWQF
jgi:hypothetical protein